MSFGETDHGFELTCGGCYSTLGGADVFTQLAHLDVGGYEGFGGGLGDARLDVGAGVGNV